MSKRDRSRKTKTAEIAREIAREKSTAIKKAQKLLKKKTKEASGDVTMANAAKAPKRRKVKVRKHVLRIKALQERAKEAMKD
jgi:hypothetical protein